MPNLIDSYKGSLPSHYLLRVCDPELVNDWPALGNALQGILAEGGDKLALPPLSFVIFADAGQTVCCVKAASGNRKAFVTLPAGVAWQTSLEAILSEGKLSWRQNK